MRLALTTSLAILAAAAAAAHSNDAASPGARSDVPASARPAVAVVDAFHAALQRGDGKAALSALAEDALIFESGGVERSKVEYASHHLGADMAFSKAVPSSVSQRHASALGSTAWVASEGRTNGTWRGRSIDAATTETMVLRRTPGGWKIVHIHWSSAPQGE